MSYYVLRPNRNNQWFFVLVASNHEPIGASEMYNSKQGALNGIESCRKHAPYIEYYTRFRGQDGQYYWNLKAANHQILLQSEGYATQQGAENGIRSCMANAPTSPTKEPVE